MHGDEDIGVHVRIVDVDVAGVAFLNEICSYEPRPEVSVHNIMAAGELALETYYQDGLRLLDLADPQEIAHYRSWDPSLDVASRYGESFFEGAIGVDCAQDTGIIYVADTHHGLLTLRQTR